MGLLFNSLIEGCTLQYIAYVYIEFNLPLYIAKLNVKEYLLVLFYG